MVPRVLCGTPKYTGNGITIIVATQIGGGGGGRGGANAIQEYGVGVVVGGGG